MKNLLLGLMLGGAVTFLSIAAFGGNFGSFAYSQGFSPYYQQISWESHPEMEAALRDLESAKDHLEKAEYHEFGGHRERAIDLTKGAIDEVRNALSYGH